MVPTHSNEACQGHADVVPLVSCILPTKNRASLLPLALRSFDAQLYPHKELVVVDNGDDDTSLLFKDRPDVRYEKVSGPFTTGEMRNLCCELARGAIISHFDSDDWSAPTRLSQQVALMFTGAVVVGYNTMWFYVLQSQEIYYWSRPAFPLYALGTSLTYSREWWKLYPFSRLQIGEDYKFFQQALKHTTVKLESVKQQMVALIHYQHTSPKNVESSRYQRKTKESLPQGFLSDVERLRCVSI